MRLYIHQQDEWPAFRWNAAALTDQLADVSRQQGRLIGRMQSLGIGLRTEDVKLFVPPTARDRKSVV